MPTFSCFTWVFYRLAKWVTHFSGQPPRFFLKPGLTSGLKKQQPSQPADYFSQRRILLSISPKIVGKRRLISPLISSGPVPYAADSLLPSSELFEAFIFLHMRRKDAVYLPVLFDVVYAVPKSRGKTCQISCSQRRGLYTHRPLHSAI